MDTVRAMVLVGAAAVAAFSGSQKPIDVPYYEVGQKVRIVGRYGQPIGTYLELDGLRHGDSKGPTKMGGGNFLVDHANGKKLEQPVDIWVAQLAGRKDGSRCRVEGYETGSMIGVPEPVLRRAGRAGPQAGWQFEVHLEVLKAK